MSNDVPVYFNEFERYPVYSVHPSTDKRMKPKFSLTEEELLDYNRVVKEFDSWQDKLGRLIYPDGY